MRLTRSMRLYEEAAAMIPGGSQTNSKRPTRYALGAYPIYADHGEGGHVWDVDGNEYIDWLLAQGPVMLGYRYSAVDDAIKEQLSKGILYGILDPLEVEVARLVIETVPSAERVKFLKGGGESTTAAVRVARAYTRREKVVSIGYHGWQDIWTAQNNDGGVPKRLEAFIRRVEFNDLPALEDALDAWPGDVAAIVINPAEAKLPQPGYLEAVRDLAIDHGALLVFDEVVTGFRLALGGAQEYFGVEPDLTCLSKAMANGMPISALCGRAEVMDVAESLRITVGFGGEALSLAATSACLREYRTRDVSAHLWRIGALLINGINSAAEAAGCPVRAGGAAPMPKIDIAGRTEHETDLMWTYFLQESAKRGVLFRRGGLDFVCFAHTEENVERSVEATADVFEGMERHRSRGTLETACRVEKPVLSAL